MLKSRFFIFNFTLLFLVFVLNSWALSEFLYWKIWWFDLLMHFLGGLFVGSSALWIFFDFRKKEVSTDKKFEALIIAILAVLIIGIGWEIYEFLADKIIGINFGLKNFNVMQPGIIDTFEDLLMDIVGALVSFLMFEKIWKRKN